jgi:hypothetical protein
MDASGGTVLGDFVRKPNALRDGNPETNLGKGAKSGWAIVRFANGLDSVGTDPACDDENLQWIGGGFGRYGCMK